MVDPVPLDPNCSTDRTRLVDRRLLVALFTISAGLGMCLFTAWRIERRLRIESAVRSCGGMIYIRGPVSLLDRLLGIRDEPRFGGQVTFVDLRGCTINQRILVELARERSIEILWLSGSSINDDDLKSLATLPNLEWVQLGDTNVGDAGAAALGRCSRLEIVDLHNTGVSDAGVKHLALLPELRCLSIGPHVTDVSFECLSNCRSLRQLSVSGKRITDDGAKLVAGSGFDEICLCGTNVGADGVRALLDSNLLERIVVPAELVDLLPQFRSSVSGYCEVEVCPRD